MKYNIDAHNITDYMLCNIANELAELNDCFAYFINK